MANGAQLIVNLHMEISLSISEFLPGWSFEGDIKIDAGNAILIHGPNGVGKSSLLQYFKLNHKSLFAHRVLRFVDQPRLNPLNDISLNDVISQLSSRRDPTQKLFQEFYPIVEDYASKPLKDLSGGQNQMCKILIGIFLGGDIYFFDEPSQSLDDTNIKNFSCCLEGLKGANKACVIIEHQSGLIKSLCQKSYGMQREGSIIKIKESHGD